MAHGDDKGTTTLGLGGLLLLPLSTVAVAARLLVGPRRAGAAMRSPYRVPGTVDGLRPLTTGGTRAIAAMLLFWTLVLPVALGGYIVSTAHGGVGRLVGAAAVVWVAMFIGHLVAMVCFRHLEPRLPHVQP